MKLITVFTPTYNRASNLNKCYQSLLLQTSKNFIWQIIDDGSTDNTEEIVKTFMAEDLIDIIYIKKSNGGKFSAINKSLEITNTELWICLDSDDYFFPDAIEIYEKYYLSIKNDENICGLFSLRSDANGHPMMGMSIPKEIKYETQFNIRYKYKIEPEYVQVYKTNIVSQYRYPVFDGENFFPLSYTQDKMDQKYKFLIIHEPTMVCEYQSDGITKNHKRLVKKNPKGYTEFKRQQIEIAPNFMFMLKACITYDTGCILSNNIKGVFLSPSPLFTIFMYPLGWLVYQLRYRKI
jgi:glycosyltransferase involved in cell wall biosynthesis